MEDRKFTLLELLIVIAMIGILVSLLLPSLTKAREAGKRAVCLSNHHQIYLGFVNYNGEYQELPPGNATTRPSIGVNSTYYTLINEQYGAAYLKVFNFIEDSNVFYCPSWTHPFMKHGKLRNDGKFGGWPQEGGTLPTWHISDTYHYRSSFGAGLDEKPDFMMDNSSGTAIYTDHFVKWFGLLGKEYGHKNAYIATYLDGHSSIVYDPKGNSMMSLQPATFTNGDWSAQETVFKSFFDK